MKKFDFDEHPHRRYNPLTGEWVLVSPHRTKRPWQGEKEPGHAGEIPSYDPGCYLCPGNERAGGKINPDYKNTFIFNNDFAALLPDTPESDFRDNSLFRSESLRGECRVICFSPKHDLTLPEMKEESIKKVIYLWAEQVADLGEKYKWVQVFENKGAIMGCSNPHPHGQIWAGTSLPNEAGKEDFNQLQYFRKHASVLLMDYLESEVEKNERIVNENEDWLVVVPFWAVWPFETLLLPRRHVSHLDDLTEKEKASLASILKRFLAQYDNLFEVSFPYTMGWHGRPRDNQDYTHWQLHAHFYPPLLRSASVKKFMVGYEMLSESQRDISAEKAAKQLRSLSEIHFKSKK